MSKNSVKSMVLWVAMLVFGLLGCSNGDVTVFTSCDDGEIGGGETDVDCGGPTCDPCGLGQSCKQNPDCVSGHCRNGLCSEPFNLRANGGLAAGSSTFDGKEFLPLNDYLTEGQANNSDEALRENFPIYGTDFTELYQTETWLPINGTGAAFSFPVENGDYTVHLHFVDWATTTQFVDDRVFHVDLQGIRVLDSLDIIAEVGKSTVLIKSFDLSVSDEQIALGIINVVGYPEIAAVEILAPGQAYLGEIVVTEPPADPDNLSAAPLSSSSIELAWTDNADNETSYEVEWRLVGEADFGAPTPAAANAQAYQAIGLHAGSEYVFRVAARNSAGLSGYSNEAHAVTLELPTVECSLPSILCVDDDAGEHQEYASIQAAVDAASAGDAIYVRAGLYPEQVIITKDNLTISAFPTEEGQAVISGAQTISGWTLADVAELDGNPNAANIYVADAPCDVRRLFQGEEELKCSRYPRHSESGEDRYLHISWVDSGNPRSNFSSSELDGVKASGYFNDARAHVKTATWRIGAARVSSSTDNGGVTLQNPVSGYDMKLDYGFFFTQVVGDIAAHGEWAWRANKIYLMSNGMPTGVEAACRTYGLLVDAGVQALEVHGLFIRRAHEDGIRIEEFSNQGVTISNNTIEDCGSYCITVKAGGGPVRILDNDISDCWLGGVDLHQTDSPLVKGNHIYEIGTKAYDDDVLTDGGYGQCCGILLIDGSNGVVTENRIDKTAYSGIGMIDFGNPGNRTISFNHITRAMLGINDGAGIYTHIYRDNSEGWDVVSDNIVEDCIGSFLGTTPNSGYYPQGVGIYLDDDSSYVNVDRNTTIRNASNMFLHDAKEIDLRDNVMYGGTRRNLLLTFTRSDCSETTGTPRNVEMESSVLYSTSSSILEMQVSHGYSHCTVLESSDYNLFHGAGSAEYIRFRISNPSETSDYNLAGWQSALGFDANSTELPFCDSSIILANPTLGAVTCTGLDGCLDVFGATVGASLAIEPFGSVILCGCESSPACGTR